MSSVFWLTAFLDYPAAAHNAGVAFWAGASGQVLSAARGADEEFATLLPVGGDDYLRVQRLGSGQARIHLDLHTTDRVVLGERVVGLGASPVGVFDGFATYLSPAGLPFCLVSQPCTVQAGPARWPGHDSVIDQVCLDVPPESYDREADFWSELLELERSGLDEREGLEPLRRDPGHPMRLLMQRLDTAPEPVAATAHLDLATTDRTAEVARLVALGAQVTLVADGWTTLGEPGGLRLCVTDRTPGVGAR